MNILIVPAHAEPASLTRALRRVAADQFRADADIVRVDDLWAAGSTASVDRRDFGHGAEIVVASAVVCCRRCVGRPVPSCDLVSLQA